MKNFTDDNSRMLESAIDGIYNGYTRFDEPEYADMVNDTQSKKICRIVSLDNFKVKKFHLQNKATIEAFFLDYLVKASKLGH